MGEKAKVDARFNVVDDRIDKVERGLRELLNSGRNRLIGAVAICALAFGISGCSSSGGESGGKQEETTTIQEQLTANAGGVVDCNEIIGKYGGISTELPAEKVEIPVFRIGVKDGRLFSDSLDKPLTDTENPNEEIIANICLTPDNALAVFDLLSDERYSINGKQVMTDLNPQLIKQASELREQQDKVSALTVAEFTQSIATIVSRMQYVGMVENAQTPFHVHPIDQNYLSLWPKEKKFLNEAEMNKDESPYIGDFAVFANKNKQNECEMPGIGFNKTDQRPVLIPCGASNQPEITIVPHATESPRSNNNGNENNGGENGNGGEKAHQNDPVHQGGAQTGGGMNQDRGTGEKTTPRKTQEYTYRTEPKPPVSSGNEKTAPPATERPTTTGEIAVPSKEPTNTESVEDNE